MLEGRVATVVMVALSFVHLLATVLPVLTSEHIGFFELPSLIPTLKEMGYEIVSVNELFYYKNKEARLGYYYGSL